MAPLKKLIHFEFEHDLVRQPLVYQVMRKFEVVINIRAAQVREDGGFMALELEGDAEEIERVLTFLRDQGATVTEDVSAKD
ncbi:MAG: NIL domain-containing protein [Planctomycetes bacterium]|nr:NIL domain-containing protein [Planctomycetota bacterium]